VFAVASDDVWAVGGNVVIHWDGQRWRSVRTPPPGAGEIDQYEDVSASGPTDVWVAGRRVIPSGEHVTFAPVVLHWDGSSWTRIVAVPGYVYNTVHAAGTGDVWVGGTSGFGQPLLAHSMGGDFEAVPTPDPSGDGGLLADINGLVGGKLLGVGTQFQGTKATPRTLVLVAPSSTQGQVIGDTNVGFAAVAWFGAASGSTETDPGGGFFAAGLPAGAYTFVVSNPGCDPAVANIAVAAGESIVRTFTLGC
jgi:hypothetical protein